VAILAALAAVFGAAVASTGRSWRDETVEAFQRGTAEGVTVDGDGALRPAPGLVPLLEGAAPRFWAVAVDAEGRIWCAGGGEGRLHRLAPDGTHEQVFRAEEPEILALAADGTSVFAATGPEGRVYRFRDGEKPEVVLDPRSRYIWDLAVGPSGRLHVATGDPARVIRLEEGGGERVLLEVPESHVRALAFDTAGAVLAATDGEGYLYRIPPEGPPSVLFAPPESELTDVVADPSGRVYVAAVGEASPSAPSPSGRRRIQGGVARITVAASAADAGETPMPEPSPTARNAGGPLASAVYAVGADGDSRRILASSQELVLALGLTAGGDLVAGTGEMGVLLRVHDDGPPDRLGVLPVSQIVGLAPDRAGGLVAVTANPGSAYRLEDHPGPSGTFVSEVKDAGSLSDWGRISWRQLGRGDVTVSVRTGNTARPDATWSSWSEPFRHPEGGAIDRPPARFVQYRLTLRPEPSAGGPVVRGVEVFYLQRNAAPVVDDLEALPAGIVMLSSANQRPPDQEAVARAEAAANGEAEGQRAPPRKTFQDGMRTFTWSATDPNDDELRFEVLYRSEGEDLWKSLARGLEEPFLSFDSRQLADGRYRVRVVASDAPSNPPDRALSGDRTSEPFDVDNTPPRVLDLRTHGDGEIRFRVEDGLGPVSLVRYSVDAGEWVPVLPVDGVPDAAEESFRIRLPVAVGTARVVVVQAGDAAGNLGSGRLLLTAP
jgi:hypothetical protein